MSKNDLTNNSSLDDVLNALAVSNIPSHTTIEKPVAVSTEYNEHEELIRTLRGLDDLIQANASVLDEARRLVESTGDAEYFEAYAGIGKAQSEAFKNKVKIITEKEKNKFTKEAKLRELEIKEKLANFTIGAGGSQISGSTTLNQTNVIMTSSREEMYEMLIKMKAHEKATLVNPVTDVEATEIEAI